MLIAGENKLTTLTIATPFYNEEDGLDYYFETLKKINILINKKIILKFLFIDDGSSDFTKQKLYDFKEKNSQYDITIFSHEKNFGYGTKDHILGLKKFGINRHHRKGFRPIYNMLSK